MEVRLLRKILLIPLDERPCNYDFPQMLAEAEAGLKANVEAGI